MKVALFLLVVTLSVVAINCASTTTKRPAHHVSTTTRKPDDEEDRSKHGKIPELRILKEPSKIILQS